MNSQNILQNPKISVLLVDGSFRSRFSMIDSLKHQTFAAADFEVLWIEYFEAVRQELIDKMNGQVNFQVITLKESGTYHSSYCFNRGITQAQGELLVIADADVLVDANFLETVWKEHQTNDQLVMYVLRMDEPERTSSLCLDLENLKKACVLTNPENYGGCLTIRKKWLLKINGYEQHDLMRGTAHANGRDLYTRFKNFGLSIKWHPELRLYHSWHPHPPGFRDAYLLQHVLIRHRATSLDKLPYNGINPALDRKIPQSLQAQLDSEKRKAQPMHPDSTKKGKASALRNCLILGSGRSGTSMLAGMLHQAGYFMGEKFHQPRESNPKGFFEWYKINRINELILASNEKNKWLGMMLKKILKRNTVDSPGLNQRWLLALPMGKVPEKVPSELEKEMRSVLGKEPYAYKDPRFSYTLPAWKPILKSGTIFICIFRDPTVTVESILKECRSQDYLADLYITRASAYRVWTDIYGNILDRLEPRYGNFVFVHYEQVLNGAALPLLENALHVSLSADFVDPILNRTQSHHDGPKTARDIYARLCRLAHYEPGC